MKVDKELVFEFLLLESDEISEVHISEVKKVIRIVLNKYHPSSFKEFDELEAQVFLKIFENKVNYKPIYDAYNYVFTIARNESGNLLKKLNKEVLVEEFWTNPLDESTGYAEIESPVIRKYYSKLMGIEEWSFIRIRQDELAELLLFFHRYKAKEIPGYLKEPKVAEKLYYILNKLLLNEQD